MMSTGPTDDAAKRRMFGQLRKREGLTQKEMAQRIGVAQSHVSQIERGERTLTKEILDTTMKEFDLPCGYFSRHPVEYDRLSLNFRRKALPAKIQDRLIITFGEEEQELQATQLPIPVVDLRVPRTGKPLNLGQIEQAADATRRRLRIGDGPVPNVIRAAESAGIIVVALDPDLAPQGKFDGLSSPVIRGNIPPVIGFVPQMAGDRQRFTVAHELGHLVLHTEHRPENEELREKEANYFAGAFLYPAKAAHLELRSSTGLSGYRTVKRQWGVSIQALLMRARSLGIIDGDRYLTLRQQVSHRGWNQVEPVLVGTESPQLADMIRHAEQDNKVVPLWSAGRKLSAEK